MDAGIEAMVNGQVSIHPGKETMDELADKDRFFRVIFAFSLFLRLPLFDI